MIGKKIKAKQQKNSNDIKPPQFIEGFIEGFKGALPTKPFPAGNTVQEEEKNVQLHFNPSRRQYWCLVDSKSKKPAKKSKQCDTSTSVVDLDNSSEEEESKQKPADSPFKFSKEDLEALAKAARKPIKRTPVHLDNNKDVIYFSVDEQSLENENSMRLSNKGSKNSSARFFNKKHKKDQLSTGPEKNTDPKVTAVKDHCRVATRR